MNKYYAEKVTRQPSLQDIQRMISCFEEGIMPNIPSKEAILQRAKQRQSKKQKINAIMLAMVGMVAGVYWYNPSYQQQDYATQFGEQKTVQLSDGSWVQLNTDTRVEVQQRLRSRELRLVQGEAVFNVAHGEYAVSRLLERRFTVTAGSVLVKDIGTVFNVDKASDTDIAVTVLQGEVDVSQINSSVPAITLKQGQSVTHGLTGFGPVESADVNAVSAWQSGLLVFDHIPLEQAIKDFQRYSHFTVDMPHSTVKTLPINGQFQAKNYQQFMQVLPHVASVNVQKISETAWRIDNK